MVVCIRVDGECVLKECCCWKLDDARSLLVGRRGPRSFHIVSGRDVVREMVDSGVFASVSCVIEQLVLDCGEEGHLLAGASVMRCARLIRGSVTAG